MLTINAGLPPFAPHHINQALTFQGKHPQKRINRLNRLVCLFGVTCLGLGIFDIQGEAPTPTL